MAVPAVANWQHQILQQIGAPLSLQNLHVLNAWAQAEGGSAQNNPFNTTLETQHSLSPYNSFVGGDGGTYHVWNYATPQAGIAATVQTLKNGYYPNILAALRQGTDAHAVAHAIANSPWGTGRGVLNVLYRQAVQAANV